jgi:3-oxoacyl-[acyl-carrier protein] reductase
MGEPMRLKGQTAVVTGAGGGIGSAISYRFAEEGANVIINDIDFKKAKKVRDKIRKRSGVANVMIADVSKWNDARKLTEDTIALYGKLDILVNNAGFPRDNKIVEMTEDEWDAVIDVCLKGCFLCSKFAAAQMVTQGRGKIVNISSRALAGGPGQANYSAAKAGIVGLTKSMAKELGRYAINVNCIAPGLILHEGLYEIPNLKKFVDRFINESPFKRAGTPLEVANAVLFLASEESNYITGEIIYVSGGRF